MREKTGKTLGDHVISLYSGGIYELVKIKGIQNWDKISKMALLLLKLKLLT